MIEAGSLLSVTGYGATMNTDKLPWLEASTSVDSRHDDRERVQQHGYWPTYTWLGQRKWNFNGEILADDPAEYIMLRRQIMRACMPSPRRGFRYVTRLQVRFTGMSEDVWAECDLDGTPEIPMAGTDGPSRGPFSIGLIQADPRVYGVIERKVILTPLGGGASGLSWNAGAGVSWNGGSGVAWGGSAQLGSATPVNHDGDIDTPPRWRIYGPCSNPQLRWLNEHGEYESVVLSGLVIDVSDYVDVDFRLRKIANSAGGSLYYSLDRDRTKWWDLLAGTNTVAFFADSYSDPCRAELYWYNAYMP